MADVENLLESSIPVKRKSDLYCQEQDNVGNKAQKLNPSSSSADKDGEINRTGVDNLNSSTDGKTVTESSISAEKVAGSESGKDENGVAGDLGAEDEQGGDIDEEEEEEEEEEEKEEEEDYAIDAEIDRKGKGISREDKGKGKLIEVEESDEEDDTDDEDDDDDGGDEFDESELSDDPLAEVDLDNILPSRTRRRSFRPGVYISNDHGGNNEDDDSSDDSDA